MEAPSRRILGFIVVVIVVGLAIGVYFSFQPIEEVPPQKAILGVESSLLPASVWVAESEGYFDEEGLDLTIREFDSGRLSFMAMLEGEVDISTVAPTPIMFSSFDRQDFYIFATFVHSNEDIKVIARKDVGINTATDLRGKSVGTPLGTTGQFLLDSFLTLNGIQASEVEVIDVDPSALPDALKAGQVDAIVIWEPHASNALQLLGDRATRLPSSEVYTVFFNFMVMKNFARDNPELLERFLRAIDRATSFIESSEEESRRIVAERLDLDPENMAIFWEDFVFEISLDQSLLVTLESVARWAIENDLVDAVEAPNYLDYIYVEALQRVKPEAVGIIR
ncbi:MAG: ABC transporter substrate-binding protein [Candidatus Geothermarchaeales archaeon]